MKPVVACAFCAAFASLSAITPATAKDDESLREGMDMLSQGTRLLLHGLLGEVEPALRDLEGALRDLNAYYPPEILPNGDIIIRRKHPKPVLPPPEDGEIDL